ncbi:hypothetical protein H0264_25785 [Nocardia huaxiensis]|uniref:Uncharacterized protein n=1 Tax=Nocardia huaxiensis TaxID=2755382 RepID=A0A7D6ZF14_9NOCA|nr:hypothetical protein [Nocardia huaxiensis]QLY28727.1 hypothetical protein H0264_25785 [Nocardia huaxiensis]
MLFAYSMLIAPVVGWLFAAETFRGRVAGAAVLGVLASGQWVLARGLLGPTFQFTGIAILTVCVMVVLVAAPIAETGLRGERVPVAGIAKARVAVGYAVGGLYCVVSGCALLFGSTLLLIGGRWSWVPAADAIGSLPEGLYVRETVDLGCTGRSSNSSCDRKFVIAGTSGTPEEIAARVQQHLSETAGWAFTPKNTPGGKTSTWKGACRIEGWVLDRHESCSWVAIEEDGTVTVHLSYVDDW